jgi:hypothetical protein
MTFNRFGFDSTPTPIFFVYDSITPGMVAEFTSPVNRIEDLAGWVQAGLNYAGPAGGLGAWTSHPSDLKSGSWAVRDPEGRVLAYTHSATMAAAVVAAMTDYPNPEPGTE